MKKRFVCVLMGIVLVLTNVMAVNALDVIGEDAIVVPGNGEGIDVIEKNMITGEITHITYQEILNTLSPSMIGANLIPSEILSQEQPANPNVVIGPDDRVPVVHTTNFPYSAIAYAEATFPDGKTVPSTAWMISDRIALTAAHCVYDSSRGGYATSVQIWPGRSGEYCPFGSASSVRIRIGENYPTQDGSDWAIISLDRSIGQQSGVINFGYAYSFSELLQREVRVSGYPGDIPGLEGVENEKYQYEATGLITSRDNNYTFYYSADAEGGQSGSPVMLSNTNYAVGIHFSGSNYEGTNLGADNEAVIFTPTLCNIINAFIAESAITG